MRQTTDAAMKTARVHFANDGPGKVPETIGQPKRGDVELRQNMAPVPGIGVESVAQALFG
ncbi:MAG: hypothetical protein WAQ05_16715 [Rubrivivax sp.]